MEALTCEDDVKPIVVVDRIIKIGGAAISDKTQFETLLPDNLKQICQLLKQNYKNLILIHGAGSFGHHQAKENDLINGCLNLEDYSRRQLGVCDTRRSVTHLHNYVVDALLKENIPVIGLSPFHFLMSNNLKIEEGITKKLELNYSRLFAYIRYLLSQNYVPLLHGDVILDYTLHWTLLSSDDLMFTLAKEFRPHQCLFVTSVPGILSNNRVLDEFYIEQDGKFHNIDSIDSYISNIIDVTGSMKKKIMICAKIVNEIDNCNVWIVNANSNTIQNLLLDEKVISGQGTRIIKRLNTD